MKVIFTPWTLVFSTNKKGIETLANELVRSINENAVFYQILENSGDSPKSLHVEKNSLNTFAALRSLQEAVTLATKLVTEAAINEALSNDKEGFSRYPGAADGKDFIVNGDIFRVTIKNEYPYGEQTIVSQDGSRRDDPTAALWRAEKAVVEKRKEDGKLSTKKIAAFEAQLRAEHPRMKPSETTISIALRGISGKN